MNAVITKLNGEQAIIECGEKAITLPVELLPDGVRIGDCVEIAVLPDIAKLEALQGEIATLLGPFQGKRIRRAEQPYQSITQAVRLTLGGLVRERGGQFYLLNLENAAEEIAKAVAEVE